MSIRSLFHPAHPESAPDSDNKEVNAADEPGDRRHLLKVLGAATVGAVGASLLEAGPAGAGTGDGADVQLGQANTAPDGTSIIKGAASGLAGTAVVVGDSNTDNGVIGTSSGFSGVTGRSAGASGLIGSLNAGVIGDSTTNSGVLGVSSAMAGGVIGICNANGGGGVGGFDQSPNDEPGFSSAGVVGDSTHAYGVIAIGGLAPLLLRHPDRPVPRPRVLTSPARCMWT